MTKLVYTNHALRRALVRLFDKKEDDIKPDEIVRMKIMLDKLITARASLSLGEGAKCYMPIDNFDGFVAVGLIEGDVIVIKTISPTTK